MITENFLKILEFGKQKNLDNKTIIVLLCMDLQWNERISLRERHLREDVDLNEILLDPDGRREYKLFRELFPIGMKEQIEINFVQPDEDADDKLFVSQKAIDQTIFADMLSWEGRDER
jgi:hypothetical protein